MPVLPLSLVIRPGNADDSDDLVAAAHALDLSPDLYEIRSARKGLEIRCVYVTHAQVVVDQLNAVLRSKVKVVERTVNLITEPDLMEPVMRIEITAPEMLVPVIMAFFGEIRGHVSATSERDDHIAITAEAPLQETLDLESRLRSLGDGEALIQDVVFSHHQRT